MIKLNLKLKQRPKGKHVINNFSFPFQNFIVILFSILSCMPILLFPFILGNLVDEADNFYQKSKSIKETLTVTNFQTIIEFIFLFLLLGLIFSLINNYLIKRSNYREKLGYTSHLFCTIFSLVFSFIMIISRVSVIFGLLLLLGSFIYLFSITVIFRKNKIQFLDSKIKIKSMFASFLKKGEILLTYNMLDDASLELEEENQKYSLVVKQFLLRNCTRYFLALLVLGISFIILLFSAATLEVSIGTYLIILVYFIYIIKELFTLSFKY